MCEVKWQRSLFFSLSLFLIVRIGFCYMEDSSGVLVVLQDTKTMKLYCLDHEDVIRRIGELMNNILSLLYQNIENGNTYYLGERLMRKSCTNSRHNLKPNGGAGKLELIFSCYVWLPAFCDRCHQGGELSQLLLCTKCTCHYHSYCCSPPVRATESVRVGWECAQCKSCQACRWVFKYSCTPIKCPRLGKWDVAA